MVVKRQCSFCSDEIEPGTGSMFVKRDGTVFHFCSSSCRKQQLHLGRVGHHLKWTRAHALRRAAEQARAPAARARREAEDRVRSGAEGEGLATAEEKEEPGPPTPLPERRARGRGRKGKPAEEPSAETPDTPPAPSASKDASDERAAAPGGRSRRGSRRTKPPAPADTDAS